VDELRRDAAARMTVCSDERDRGCYPTCNRTPNGSRARAVLAGQAGSPTGDSYPRSDLRRCCRIRVGMCGRGERQRRREPDAEGPSADDALDQAAMASSLRMGRHPPSIRPTCTCSGPFTMTSVIAQLGTSKRATSQNDRLSPQCSGCRQDRVRVDLDLPRGPPFNRLHGTAASLCRGARRPRCWATVTCSGRDMLLLTCAVHRPSLGPSLTSNGGGCNGGRRRGR